MVRSGRFGNLATGPTLRSAGRRESECRMELPIADLPASDPVELAKPKFLNGLPIFVLLRYRARSGTSVIRFAFVPGALPPPAPASCRAAGAVSETSTAGSV